MRIARGVFHITAGAILISCAAPTVPDRPDVSGRWQGAGTDVNWDATLTLVQEPEGTLRGIAVTSSQFAYRVTGQVQPDGRLTLQLTDTVFVSPSYTFSGQVQKTGQRIEGQLSQGGINSPFSWTRPQLSWPPGMGLAFGRRARSNLVG